MQKTLQRILGVIALVPVLLSTPVLAGFGGNGVTPVPITEEGLDKDALEIFDRNIKAWEAGGEQGPRPTYPPFEEVPAERINVLKLFPPFQGKSDAEIKEKVLQMRRALICTIELIEREDPKVGQGLMRLLRLRKICFGLLQTGQGLGAAIFPDGDDDFGVEPINIFYGVCEDLTLTDFDLFVLYNGLSHEGTHAVQDILKPTGGVNLAEAVDLQCREIEAHQGEVTRICNMQAVIASIKQTGKLPDNITGATLSFGAGILAANNTAALVAEWETELRKLKRMREHFLRFREIYKELGQAALNNATDFSELKKKLRPYREWVKLYGGRRDFGVIGRATIFSRAPIIGGSPGSRTVSGGGMRQIVPPENIEQDITLPGIDAYSDGLFWEEDNVFFLLGVHLSTGGDPDMGEIWRFDVDATTGALLPATAVKCMETPLLGAGGDLFKNPFEGANNLSVLAVGSADVYDFTDGNSDGCPDGLVHRGSLPQRPFFEITDVVVSGLNTLHGYPGPVDTVAGLNQSYSTGQRSGPGGSWSGTGPTPWQEAFTTDPAIAGLPWVGRPDLPCVGTPGRDFDIFLTGPMDPPRLVGEGTFGWRGWDCPVLTEPLNDTELIQVVDELGKTSAPTPAVPAPGDAAEFLRPPELTGNAFNLVVGSWPGGPIGEESTASLATPGTPGPGATADDWGEAFFSFPIDGMDQSFHGFSAPPIQAPTAGSPKTFTIAAGLTVRLDVADTGDPSLNYEMVDTPTFSNNNPLNPELWDFKKDGTFTMTLLTFSGPVSFTYRVLSVSGGPVSSPKTVVVSVDNSALVNPVPYIGEGGETNVMVAVLNLSGQHYPLYQFRLANSPADLCEEPHWHSGTVFPLEAPMTGIPDPDGAGCGFGIYPDLSPEPFEISKAEWDAFLALHASPF
jgi:hypothetical protein